MSSSSNTVTEIVAFSESAVRNNAAVVEYCRTSMSALSGSTAGILGLTGFLGFGFYVFAVFGLWVKTFKNVIHVVYIPLISSNTFFVFYCFVFSVLNPIKGWCQMGEIFYQSPFSFNKWISWWTCCILHLQPNLPILDGSSYLFILHFITNYESCCFLNSHFPDLHSLLDVSFIIL